MNRRPHGPEVCSSSLKTVAVDWRASYQTAKFGEEKWAINYIALVRGHELTPRAELLCTQPDHPRANEQYFKIQLSPLERLPRAVPSHKWRRITFCTPPANTCWPLKRSTI